MHEDVSIASENGFVDEIERATNRIAEEAVVIEEVQSLPIALLQSEISPS